MKPSLFVLIVLVLNCCSVPESKDAGYIKLDSLLNEQISQLAKQGFQLQKKMEFNMELTDTTVTPSKENWESELALLFGLNPNQNSYLNAWDIEHSEMLGQQVVSYTLKDNQNLPVKKLAIGKQGKDISFLRGEIAKQNAILNEKQWISAEFEEGVLKEYLIIGGKKQMFSDSVYYQIQGIILN